MKILLRFQVPIIRAGAAKIISQMKNSQIIHGCAAARWRLISAQLGIFAIRSVSSCMQPGISIFCGQIAAHAPQPRQADGCCDSGKAEQTGSLFFTQRLRMVKGDKIVLHLRQI